MKILLLTLFAVLLSCSLFSQTEKRIALVVGNSAYTTTPLKNSVNDASLMATTLQGLGFTVIKKINVTKAQLEQAVQQFSEKLSVNNVALFYYAGHGMQANGINYLIPIDAKLDKESDLKYQAVNINFIVEEFQQYPQNTNIVILDACRDNPLASWARGGTRGFKAISPSSGTIISFATAEGNTASDGVGVNGLFTSKLVEQMKVAQPIESVFKNTRIQVLKSSEGKQSPQEWSMLIGNFQFVDGKNSNLITNTPLDTLLKNQKNENLIITEEVLTGKIHITNELDGEFYIDGKLIENFSKGRIYTLNNIEIGSHTLKIGNWSESLIVEKDKIHEVFTYNILEFNETVDNLNIMMVLVKGSTFQMGSNYNKDEKPIHSVTINDFYIGKYEVTQFQWQTIMGRNPSKFDNCENCPVENVSWNDIQTFVKKLNQKTGKKYRLPTEAEWEYAARGGIASIGSTNTNSYSGSNNLEDVGWYKESSGSLTHLVGGKKPNELGLYDMSGNVWEWCFDWHDSHYYAKSQTTNPQGPPSGSYRVCRGGSWIDSKENCRVTFRNFYGPSFGRRDLGFRLVLSSR